MTMLNRRCLLARKTGARCGDRRSPSGKYGAYLVAAFCCSILGSGSLLFGQNDQVNGPAATKAVQHAKPSTAQTGARPMDATSRCPVLSPSKGRWLHR